MPETLHAALALVFALGLRHGFDPDHLATIDALTRWNQPARPVLARWCGLVFSAGHGAVVTGAAIALTLGAQAAGLPDWMETVGVALSTSILAMLAALNVAAVLRAPAGQPVRPLGLKGRFFERLGRRSSPLSVAMLGALFAVSFDTATQGALFAAFSLPLAGDDIAGWVPAALLGLTFTGGMVVTDGLNGWWMSRLIGRSNRVAVVASRTMGLAVGAMAFTIACFGLARLISGPVGDWAEGRELWLGLAVICWMVCAFALGLRLARQAAATNEAMTMKVPHA
jgi:high-affinity nickel-transport protein